MASNKVEERAAKGTTWLRAGAMSRIAGTAETVRTRVDFRFKGAEHSRVTGAEGEFLGVS